MTMKFGLISQWFWWISLTNTGFQMKYYKYITKLKGLSIFYSGGSERIIETYEDINKFRQLTNASSVMIARAAQWNMSVFRKEGILPMDTVIRDYLSFVCTKWSYIACCAADAD